MGGTKVQFDLGTLPLTIQEYVKRATTLTDSSCSDNAKTLFVAGSNPAYLKISSRDTLLREYHMTDFLSRHHVAPLPIAYASDAEHDYLLTEAVMGEDGSASSHREQPERLAAVFGEYLRMLHSLPTEGCPYKNRTAEMINQMKGKKVTDSTIHELKYFAVDDVIIHGDYCLPNIIMDHFSFKAFIDLGYGGVGDRHYDLYWGIWTLNYNLKTNRYADRFLDAYGRTDIDLDKLACFGQMIEG